MCLGTVGARHVVRVVQRGLIVGHHLLREVLVRNLRLGFGGQSLKVINVSFSGLGVWGLGFDNPLSSKLGMCKKSRTRIWSWHSVRVVQRGLVVGHHFLREVLVRDLRLGFGF